jgi:predicted outer membrane repeat protein
MVSLTLAAAKLHSAVVLVNNIIEHNSAGDDGGGVYATGKALVGITGAEHRIRNNEAQFNGGGVRATFGSVVSIQGGHIELNSANNSNNDGGGGGVAFSNSVAKIVDCEIVNNTVIDFGGGGVYLITAEYTGLKGLAFETLLEDAYQFTQGGIELDGCVITGNAALDNHGAAGGLYVTYKQYPIKVKVKDTVLSPNAAQHSDVNKRWNVVIVSSADATNLANDKDLPQPITLLNHEKLYNP